MSKANFDDAYSAADPRRYYDTLAELDYEIPRHSATLFRQVAEQIESSHETVVMDVCSSYGVNAAVINHNVDFAEVVDHYRDPSAADLSRTELLARDHDWFSTLAYEDQMQISGLDVSAPALDYATDAGLHQHGYAENLEVAKPSERLADHLEDIDLISVSGGIGYITSATIGQLLDGAQQPWLAALNLRWVDFTPIAEAAAARGMVTERLDDATFRQRRFADGGEQAHAVAELADLGIDAEGRETDGWHHTDFYLVRPAEDAANIPLSSFISPEGAISSPAAGSELQVTVI